MSISASEVKKIREEAGLTQDQFAKKLFVSLRTVQNWEAGVNKVPKATELLIRSTFTAEYTENVSAKTTEIPMVVVDTKGEEVIVTILSKARAGYLTGHGDPAFIEELPITILPEKKFKASTTRCFEVAGDSMEPTLRDRDYVYCTYVQKEQWDKLKENRVYVLVTLDGIIIKRVGNVPEAKLFFCMSDNQTVAPFRVQYKNVIEVWEARRRMTADFGRKVDPKNVPYIEEFGMIAGEE